MIHTAFIILHYKNYELTSKCVDRILNLCVSNDVHISVLVVDNFSPNESYVLLKRRYENNQRVYLFRTDENLGFSRANNAGFAYARDKMGAERIIVINNDAFIAQRSFMSRLESEYNKHGRPHIIGPDIYTPVVHGHQSPLRPRMTSREEMEAILAKRRQKMLGEEDLIDTSTMDSLKRVNNRLKQALKRNPVGRSYLLAARLLTNTLFGKERRRINDCVPCGAALVFTERFVRTGELPFDPPTFFYHEEDLLALRARAKGWTIMYTPKLRVLHLGGASTEEGDEFVNANLVSSAEIWLAYWDELYAGGAKVERDVPSCLNQ